MSRDTAAGRFEVHAASASALAAAQGALATAVQQQGPDIAGITMEPWTRLHTITVRITGRASAIGTVRRSVESVQGVRVGRDWLDVPAAADVYPDQRALARIDPLGASRRETGTGTPVIVAVVDSGIMEDHPDLKGYLWATAVGGRTVHGARCMGGVQDHDLTDQDTHGTRLAGTVLATANGVSGLRLMAVKFFDVITQPNAVNAAAAIRFAVDHGANIINLSFDLGIGSGELEEAIGHAGSAGVLVVIAAGNSGGDNDEYPVVPACYARTCPDHILVVMATDCYDGRPTFSNFGRQTVDLAAPGVGIVSTRPFLATGWMPRRYGRYTGTSAAAAQVTGAAALLKSQDPTRTARDLKRCLVESVDRLPQLACASGGRLDLGRAVSWPP